MKWVTRDHVHMDRVATPWLIRRFVDRDASFVFVPSAEIDRLPADAIPFGIPGVELSAHDAEGSTFRKVLRKYKIEDPALERVARIIEAGIAHYYAKRAIDPLHEGTLSAPEGIGLEAISQGMLYLASGDHDNIERSAPLYDALYAFCRAGMIEAKAPELAKLPPAQRNAAVRARLRDVP